MFNLKTLLPFLIILLILSSATFGYSDDNVNYLIQLKEQIQLLNLVNGLGLSADQMRIIIQNAEKVAWLKEQSKNKICNQTYSSDRAITTLEKLKTVLDNNQNIPDHLKKDVHQVNSGLRETKWETSSEITRCALDVKKALKSHQLYALNDFIPCLIPPSKGSRIGQAQGEGLEKHLEKIRRIPARIYERKQEKIVERAFNKIKHHLPKGFFLDENAEKRRLYSILEQVRNLPDVDFAIKKSELAAELRPEYHLPIKPIDITVKIERFLLAPAIIPILKDRLNSHPESLTQAE